MQKLTMYGMMEKREKEKKKAFFGHSKLLTIVVDNYQIYAVINWLCIPSFLPIIAYTM